MLRTLAIVFKLVLLAASVAVMLGSGICSAWFLYSGSVRGIEMVALNLTGWLIAFSAAFGAYSALRALVRKLAAGSQQ